jgi:protein tyrosine/serine phosphatase
MKKKKFPIGFVIVLLVVITSAVLLVKHFHIKGFHIVRRDVLYVSGQPRGMDYTRLLYKYHIATIVNVRSSIEHRDRNWHNEEVISTRNSGVKYIEMPIDKNNPFPDQQTIDKFFSIMSDKTNLPVLLHGSGDDERVAMLTAVWLRKNQKCTVEEITSMVQKIIDRQELTKAEAEYLQSLDELK